MHLYVLFFLRGTLLFFNLLYLMDHSRKVRCCYFLFKGNDEQYVCRAYHHCIPHRLLTHITSQRRVGATITTEMGLTTM